MKTSTRGGMRGGLVALACAGLLASCASQQEYDQALDLAKQYEREKYELAEENARLLQAKQAEALAEETATRRSMVGSGDRSEKIRTYNYPQNRVTDHRINLTLYKLDRMMGGELSELITALQANRQAELLAAQQDD